MKFHYFISYATENGFGNGEHITKKPIRSIDDVKRIAREFEKEFDFRKGSIVIINYQIFDFSAEGQ